jgi:hypothetical protein
MSRPDEQANAQMTYFSDVLQYRFLDVSAPV